jgi:hypothetical protein
MESSRVATVCISESLFRVFAEQLCCTLVYICCVSVCLSQADFAAIPALRLSVSQKRPLDPTCHPTSPSSSRVTPSRQINSSPPPPPTRVLRPLPQRPLYPADKRIHHPLETHPAASVTYRYCKRRSKTLHLRTVAQRRTADDPSAHLRSDKVFDVCGRRSGTGEAECAG